jgi:hypothetical protein
LYTITSDGVVDVCGATDPFTGGAHGSVVPVVGGTVDAVVDDVVVVATVVLVVVADEVVVFDAEPESSSPLHAAAASTSTPASAVATTRDLERITHSVNEGPGSTIADLTTAREKS